MFKKNSIRRNNVCVTFLPIHYLQEINDDKILLLFFTSFQSNLVRAEYICCLRIDRKKIYIYIYDSLISIDRLRYVINKKQINK